MGTNRYAYSGGDPVNRLDKNGNWFGADDVVTGPLDELAVFGALGVSAYLGVPGAQGLLNDLKGVVGLGNSKESSGLFGNTPEIRERKVGELQKIDSPGHNAPRPELESLSDDDLMGMEESRKPKGGAFLRMMTTFQ